MASGGDKPFLPSEVIINILKRLPVKFIIQFRCVCKDWKNLSKTPYFIAEHARHSAHENPLLLLHESDFDYKGTSPSLRLVNHKMETIEILSIPSIDCFRHGWEIISSCNGLLCVKVDLNQDLLSDEIDHNLDLLSDEVNLNLDLLYDEVDLNLDLLYDEDDLNLDLLYDEDDLNLDLLYDEADLNLDTSPRSLCLWNPLIREIRKIPQTKKDHQGFSVFGIGFGFSSIINDYKIVKFYRNKELCNKKNKRKNVSLLGAEVYSLSTGSWKELGFGALQNTTIISNSVSADGTIRWLGVQGTFHVVVSFDIATEVFQLTPIPLPLPSANCVSSTRTTLGSVYQNKFAIFQHYRNISFNSIDVWVMEEVASESGKSFSCIEKNNIGSLSWLFHALCIWRNQIVCRDEYSGDCFLELFNVTTRKSKTFHNSPDYDLCSGFNYERSLALL